MKGITIIFHGELSEAAKEREAKRVANREKKLAEMKADFENGKFEHIISQL